MSSKSSSSKTYNTNDNRVAVDGESIGISGGRDVSVHMVPDEAFDLAELSVREIGDTSEIAIDAVRAGAADTTREIGDALFRSLEAQREETSRLLEKTIKWGIPAAVIAYVAARVWD